MINVESIPVYSVVPNQRDYTETISYKTKIFTSFENYETRSQEIITPRYFFSYKLTGLSSSLTSYLFSVNEVNKTMPCIQPRWSTYENVIPYNVNATDTTILVRHLPNFVENNFIILIDSLDNSNVYVKEITAISLHEDENYQAGYITFSSSNLPFYLSSNNFYILSGVFVAGTLSINYQSAGASDISVELYQIQ